MYFRRHEKLLASDGRFSDTHVGIQLIAVVVAPLPLQVVLGVVIEVAGIVCNQWKNLIFKSGIPIESASSCARVETIGRPYSDFQYRNDARRIFRRRRRRRRRRRFHRRLKFDNFGTRKRECIRWRDRAALCIGPLVLPTYQDTN